MNNHQLQYYLVWCSKRKKSVLTGNIKNRLEQIVNEVANELGIKIIELTVNPDHVRLLISAHSKISVHKIIKRIKARTSHVLRREFPELLKLPSLWTRSYFVTTVGEIQDEIIKEYVESQRGK